MSALAEHGHQVVKHAEVVEECVLLESTLEPEFGQAVGSNLADIAALQPDTAQARHQRRHRVVARALACAVRADDAEQLARVDLPAHVVERYQRAVANT